MPTHLSLRGAHEHNLRRVDLDLPLGLWTSVVGPVAWVFLPYLFLWSFFVGSALMSACGLAGHALFPQLSVRVWAVIHALGAMVFVGVGGYGSVERVMKVAIGVMFLAGMSLPLLYRSLRNRADYFWGSIEFRAYLAVVVVGCSTPST